MMRPIEMERPTVDVIVPFRGSSEALGRVKERLAALSLHPGDSVLVIDNTPGRGNADAERPTPAFARNRGAARGSAEWLVFLDADTVPRPDLLDCYFNPAPGPRTGLIGGGVVDEAAPTNAPVVARYA